MALSYTWDLAGDSIACTARLRTCLQVAGYGVHHIGLVDEIELHADLLCQLVHRRHQIEFELCVLLPARLSAGGARHMCLTQLTAGQVRACGRDRLAIRVALLASYRHYFLHYKELKACDSSLAVCTSLQAYCTRYRLQRHLLARLILTHLGHAWPDYSMTQTATYLQEFSSQPNVGQVLEHGVQSARVLHLHGHIPDAIHFPP